jgi:thiamine-monophosphate kinase
MASDMLLDGVHFDSKKQPIELIGRKAIACNLSDCAAMAVRPVAATVSLAVPKSASQETVQSLLTGMRAISKEYGLSLVGGDTTRWDHPWAIDVAITAEPYEGVEPVTRSGAKPGNRLYVTGPLGGSLLGGHLTFTPRVKEAHRLAVSLGDRLTAMMDISDGLSLDLWRLCQASGVGAVLYEADLDRVISDDSRTLAARGGEHALKHALCDGEDFELLLAVEPGDMPSGVTLFPVGLIEEQGYQLKRRDGSLESLTPEGFIH